MAKRNSLPSWYPAACHAENIHWSLPQWIEALSHRSQLVRTEAAGELELEQLEAVIRGSATPTPYPTVIPFHVDIGQPDAVLLQWFVTELKAARKQPYSPIGCGICEKINRRKSKPKLLNLIESFGKLHRFRVLDWVDLMLWSRLAHVTLEAQYLGDIFWPDEEIDRRYRLATSTRPIACQLVSQSVIYTLSRVGCEL